MCHKAFELLLGGISNVENSWAFAAATEVRLEEPGVGSVISA